jgi:regulator of protease activity HflC (stomatin/prohibitin superfamily)
MNLDLIIPIGIIVLLFLIFVLPGFFTIGAKQVGVMIRKNFGARLPEGKYIATKGEVGIQADTLMPGFYWRFKILWSVRKEVVTVIEKDEVGLVTSRDGKPLPAGRLLGDEVDCESFQDARKFLQGGGYKGPQVGILRPGVYRINTSAFEIIKEPATKIAEKTIGIIVAKDGISLPTGYVIAPRPVDKEDKAITNPRFYQDGQGFISSKGYRGPQLDTLQPGTYYINTLLFETKKEKVADIPPGYVAVIRSNVGLELEKPLGGPKDTTGEGKLSGPVHEAIEKLLILDKYTRGIWLEPVAPGTYNLNTLAYTPYLVPTSAVTIDWASEGKIGTEIQGSSNKDEGVLYKFNPLKVTSKDGFLLEVNVRVVIRIQPANAAYIIARFGSVDNLIDQIVHPLIDSSFRNKAGEKKAIDFFQSRTELQKDALDHAKTIFSEYNVEAQNLLVAYIDIPANLLDTQTKKEIALQQQSQYTQEAEAQKKNIDVQEQTARANKQKDVVSAELEIGIKENLAKARIKEAEGEATYKEKTSAAEGIGKATGYSAQVKALGSEGTTLVNVINSLADKGLKFVPEIMVGGGGEGDGNLSNLIGTLVAKVANDLQSKDKTITSGGVVRRKRGLGNTKLTKS